MNITDFYKKINIGEAYRVDGVYGRITGFDKNSTEYHGEYAVVFLSTPHGTKIQSGRAYLNKITSIEDLNTLYEYENIAIEEGIILYENELNNIDYKYFDRQNVAEVSNMIDETEREFAPIPGWFPLEVQLEITYDCTLKCTMCYNGVRAHNLKFEENLKECEYLIMTDEQEKKFYRLIDVCLENGAKFFTITGGEPLLYPELVCNLIKKIKQKGCYASINTNSTLITDELAFKLKEAGLNSALTSIHGPSEEVHSKIVCTSGAYIRSLTGIKHLLNNNIHVVPNFVASHVNVDSMYETAKMLYDLGIKKQAYSIFIPTPGVKHHEFLTMTKEDYQTYFIALQQLNSEYPDLSATATLPVPPCLAGGLVDTNVLDKFEHRTCPSGRQFMVVNTNGNVSPCIQHSFDEKYGKDLLSDSQNIVDSMKDWKKLFNTPEKCMECSAKSYCNPCNMNVLVNNNSLGSTSIPYPNFNSLTKEDAENLTKKYGTIIAVKEEDLNKIYILSEDIILREESNGYITVINPNIQGYTVLSNIKLPELQGNFKIADASLYQLLVAMNSLKESKEISNYSIISGGTIPKYKILTEFIGKDFDDENLVYCLRTDTAGRFFCLANTPKEKEEYVKAEKVYKKYIAKGQR